MGTYHVHTKRISHKAPFHKIHWTNRISNKLVMMRSWEESELRISWRREGGYLWTKFVVPSKGSTIHVGASVNSGVPFVAEVSSPMNCTKTSSVVLSMWPCTLKIGWRKVNTCRFGSAKWFCPRSFVQFAEASKRCSKAVHLPEKSVIDMIWVLFLVSDWPMVVCY
jgi:hypothetical protein